MLDVVLLTDHRFVNPEPNEQFLIDLLLEDQLLMNALEQIGLKTARVAWDDPKFDWKTTKCAIFRSTWNYIDHFKKFTNWLNYVSTKTQLINSAKTIKWNSDKHYLIELKEKGIHIAPTLFLEINQPQNLAKLHQETNWENTILKPVISASGKNTYKITTENIEYLDRKFKFLNKEEAYMLQPFQTNIVKRGEISIMMINGQFTHAVLKIAKAGDFRVQSNFGGSVQIYHPSQTEILFATSTLDALEVIPIYARIDVFYDNDNELALAELELIEPELWFRLFPKAVDFFAEAVLNLVRT